jgi:TetR/AcrR family transcriptional regulator
MAKSERDQDTRLRILEIAETQFGAKGYSGTHLQSIAEAVGVQKTALYYYFPSKRALYSAVLERMLETFEEVVGRATKRGEPSAAAIGRAIDDLNDVLAQHPNFARILIRIFVDRIEIDASTIEPIIEGIINPLLRFYADGVAKGVFRKLSSRHVLLSVLGAATFHYAAGQSSSDILGVEDIYDPEAADWRRNQLRELLVGGILPRREGD